MTKADPPTLPLVRDQAETLFRIVQFALAHGDAVPAGADLAACLEKSYRNSLACRKRILVKYPDCFVRRGKVWKIVQDQICTERETAKLLLQLYEIGLKNGNGDVAVTEIVDLVHKTTENKTEREIVLFIDKLVKPKYLTRIPANKNKLRIGSKTYDHLSFLKKLDHPT